MNKQPIKLFDFWQETIDALTREGLLLCSVDAGGRPNVMTIGWLTGGWEGRRADWVGSGPRLSREAWWSSRLASRSR